MTSNLSQSAVKALQGLNFVLLFAKDNGMQIAP